MKDFLFVNNWMDREYAQLGQRFMTMKLALNLLLQSGGTKIVETGCARQIDDWGAGMSTILFADFCKRNEGKLDVKVHTIDNDPVHLHTCRQMLITAGLEKWVSMTESCSVKALWEWGMRWGKIDLLYLDSFDYPYGELLNLYGGQTDIESATRQLNALSLEEVVEKHGEIIKPSQEHCLSEIKAALPWVNPNGVVIIDDNNLAGGGKPRMAKDFLLGMGWTCLLDWQQSVWIKR